jgi:hypothetical protein
MFPPMRHLVRLGHAISEWPVASQQQSRRNAMVALTACARRRAEREEVAMFLAEKDARHEALAPAATPDHEVAVHA